MFIDTFFRNNGENPARTVQMLDFREIEKESPTVAKVFLGHVLAEYYGAAAPGPGSDRGQYHGQRSKDDGVPPARRARGGGDRRRADREGAVPRSHAAPGHPPGRYLRGLLWSGAKFQIRFQPGTRSINTIWVSEPFRGK